MGPGMARAAVRRWTSGQLRGWAIAVAVAAGGLGLAGWRAWSSYRSGALWREAIDASRARAWDRVETALSRRTWYQPDDPAAIALRVEAALRRGDREAAAQALATVPDSSPQAESAHLSRGRLLKELYRPAEAVDELRACLRLNPGQLAAHRELIIIFGIERRAREQETQLWALYDCIDGAIEALRILAQSTVTIPPGRWPRRPTRVQSSAAALRHGRTTRISPHPWPTSSATGARWMRLEPCSGGGSAPLGNPSRSGSKTWPACSIKGIPRPPGPGSNIPATGSKPRADTGGFGATGSACKTALGMPWRATGKRSAAIQRIPRSVTGWPRRYVLRGWSAKQTRRCRIISASSN